MTSSTVTSVNNYHEIIEGLRGGIGSEKAKEAIRKVLALDLREPFLSDVGREVFLAAQTSDHYSEVADRVGKSTGRVRQIIWKGARQYWRAGRYPSGLMEPDTLSENARLFLRGWFPRGELISKEIVLKRLKLTKGPSVEVLCPETWAEILRWAGYSPSSHKRDRWCPHCGKPL